MKLFKRLKLIFTYPGEIDQILIEAREKKEEELRLSRGNNLNLCTSHQQASFGSHHAKHNCDYCKLQRRHRKLQDRIQY